jgi:hypothetical protein
MDERINGTKEEKVGEHFCVVITAVSNRILFVSCPS